MNTAQSRPIERDSKELASIARGVMADQAEAIKKLRDARAAAEANQKAVVAANAARITAIENEYTEAKKTQGAMLDRIKAIVNSAKGQAPTSIWSSADRLASSGSGASRQLSALLEEAQAIETRVKRAQATYNAAGGGFTGKRPRTASVFAIAFVVVGLSIVLAVFTASYNSLSLFTGTAIIFSMATNSMATHMPTAFFDVLWLCVAAVNLALGYGMWRGRPWVLPVAVVYCIAYAAAVIEALRNISFFIAHPEAGNGVGYGLGLSIAGFVLFVLMSLRDEMGSWYRVPARLTRAGARIQREAVALIETLRNAEQSHTSAITRLTSTRDSKRATAQMANNTDTSNVNRECAVLLQTAEQGYRRSVASLRETLAHVAADLPFNTAHITSQEVREERRQPEHERSVRLSDIRLAALTADPSTWADMPLPLLDRGAMPPSVVPLTLERALLIEAAGPAKQQAVDAIQALLFRLLAALPPGRVQFTFVDPISLGKNVAGFMSLGEYDRRLVNGKAWTEPQHIEDRLLDLTEQVENIIQKNLRNDYTDIEDYNARNDIPLPYHIVVIFDFPTNLRDDALRRVLSLATQGARCGVYPVILRDTSPQLAPREFSMDALRQACTCVTLNGSRFVWDDPAFRDYTLSLDAAPDDDLLKQAIETVGPLAAAADRVEYPFKEIAPVDEAAWWQERADSSLDVPLGPTEGHEKQKFHVDEENRVSGLIVGQPGSGKSTLLHTLLTNLALRYSPDDVRLYLVDMKQGVEFEAFARERLPHARVVAIDSDREFGLSVLREVEAELERRGELFRNSSIQNLAQYRRGSIGRQPMPRILVAIDEFHRLFDEDDDISSQAGNILDHLVRQGRAYGIHLLLATQTLDGQRRLSRATKDLIQVRIALQSSDTDSRLALADDNGAARLLSRPGEAIYNDNSGRIDSNHQFQVAYLGRDEQTEYLRLLRSKALGMGRTMDDQIIFDGNHTAEMDSYTAAGSQIAAAQWPDTAYPLRAWLGEPVEIRDSVAATFRRQSGANVLVMGQRPELALGLITSALVGMASQIRPTRGAEDQPAQFYVADLSPADNPAAESLEGIRAALPHDVRVVRSRHLPEVVMRLATEVDRRLALRDDTADAILSPIILTIFGLQSARDLRPDDPYAGAGSSGIRFGEADDAPVPTLSASQAFMKLLRDGPEVGIHAIIWCDTVSNFDRTIPRGGLREFALRAIFRCSREDSQNIVNSAAAESLPPYRALLYDDDSNALTKFRPYAIPSSEWLQKVREQLLARP